MPKKLGLTSTTKAANNIHPTAGGFEKLDSLAKAIARAMGYSNAAFALEVVSIQNSVFARAERGEVCLYREDSPYPFNLDGLDAFHSGLRLSASDAEKLRAQLLGCSITSHKSTTAPVVEVPASEPRPAATVTHTTKTPRKDSIDPVIELAQTKCRDPKDTNQVWPQMQVLADSEQAPFIASTEKGLKYHKNGGDAYFTRNALDKRLHPEKRKPAADRR